MNVPHASPSPSPSWLASEVKSLPQHLAAGYLLPYVVSTGAAYMMVSERGTVSLSRDAWFARNDRLPMLRLHQFHRPSDGTSGELGLIQPRSSSFFLLYTNHNNMSSVCLFDRYRTNNSFCLMWKYEQHTSLLSWP